MSRPPVIVYDSNHDALQRRLGALRELDAEIPLIGVSSRTAVLVLAAAAEPGTLVLVDLFASDRVALDRPGERLIRRLLHNPATAHVRPVAWSAQPSPDVIGGVHHAGGRGFVAATLDHDQEREALRRALAGETVWPAGSDSAIAAREANWEAWFEQHFGLAWEPWIEPALVRLASTRERSAVLAELVEQDAARSVGQAATRMRLVARAVAGEHRNSASAVAAGASLALSHIAAHRTLPERPEATVSLEHGARTIRTAPSLVQAAGLTEEEVEEVIGLDSLIQAQRLEESSGAGAPMADQVRNERRWAAVRRVRAAGAVPDDVDAVVAGVLARLDEALCALDDARQDELYHPEGRAAAALQLVRPGEAPFLPEADLQGGEVTWRGLTPAELARRQDIDVAELHALSDAIDALIGRRPAS